MTTQLRTAIVTGAARRVGRVIAESLLADGWTVIAHVHRAGDEVADGAVGIVADLADENCAERIFAAAADRPPVRLLVNNASQFGGGSLDGFQPEELNEQMAVNLRAPILLTRALAERHDGGDACIVNLLDAKLAALNPDFLSYTLSKQALAGFTELAARALAGQGIRVNGIAPALMLQSAGQRKSNFAAMQAFNPLARPIEPADVVEALRYLAQASTVTGQIITIDGGQRFWSLPRDVQFLERT